MKKLLAFIICILMLVGMCSVYAIADGSFTNCEHYNQTVTATETGYINILFSNGYNGFCIKFGLDEAQSGNGFTVDNMGLAVNNKNAGNISAALKVMFVDYFNDLFDIDSNTMTCSLKDERKTQRMVWYFSDGYTSSVDLNFVSRVAQSAADRAQPIPDHGYTVKVNNTTLATFDFHVLRTGKSGQQNFWTYKVTLSAYPAPVVTTPAVDKKTDVNVNSSAQFSVTAENAEQYQWQADKGDGSGFVNIDGAASATYTTSAVTSENENYSYRCVVTNTAGQDISPVFTLNMIEPPVFTVPTSDSEKNVYEGKTETFTVEASNEPTYQWQVDKGDGNGFVNIDGATSVNYTTPVITDENDGYKYRCVATNSAGNDTSKVFSVKMIPAPSFTVPDTDKEVQVDERTDTVLSVTAQDAVSYQWQKFNGETFENIDGANESTYTTPILSEENTGDKYRCVASNPAGDTESFTYTIKVNNVDPPVITKGNSDTNTEIKKGDKAVFKVEAEDADTYQWQVDTGNGFTDIEGADKPEYTAAPTESGTFKYRCVVGNGNDVTVSGTYTLKVADSSSDITEDTSSDTSSTASTDPQSGSGTDQQRSPLMLDRFNIGLWMFILLGSISLGVAAICACKKRSY